MNNSNHSRCFSSQNRHQKKCKKWWQIFRPTDNDSVLNYPITYSIYDVAEACLGHRCCADELPYQNLEHYYYFMADFAEHLRFKKKAEKKIQNFQSMLEMRIVRLLYVPGPDGVVID
jgi:hypothetical protein